MCVARRQIAELYGLDAITDDAERRRTIERLLDGNTHPRHTVTPSCKRQRRLASGGGGVVRASKIRRIEGYQYVCTHNPPRGITIH
jgi:hypothetical protein